MSRWSEDLLGGLPAGLQHPLERASALARELGVDLYLVGGGVRDLLLGADLRDLDFVWEGEGDPRRFGHAFGAEFEVPVSYHPQFLTASLTLPNGLRIDTGRARRESYATAAALPRVEAASLAEDLGRRDFSVNAMAVSLAAPGALIDPCGGSADLELRHLRILHDGSFRDDPTRILRGCELAVRRHLVFEAETSARIAEAVEARIPRLLSGPRVRHELQRLFGSPRRATAGAELLRALGLDGALRSAFEFDSGDLARLERLEAWKREPAGSNEPLDRDFWLVALSALFWSRPRSVRRELADWLHLSRAGRDWLESTPDRLAPLLEPAPAIDSTLEKMATLYSGLSEAEIRMAELLGARSAGERLSAIRELAELELAISGQDLLAAGVSAGPWVGEALAATLTARRRKQIPSHAELAFALEWLAGKGDDHAR